MSPAPERISSPIAAGPHDLYFNRFLKALISPPTAMKSILLLTVIAFSVTVSGCSTAPAEKGVTPTEVVPKAEDHQHPDASEAIELNNGERWPVDKNMVGYIRNMEADLETFSGTAPQDYKVLSEKLQTNLEALTSNCTMTGQAHDELHKWLLPFIDGVNTLSEANSTAAAAVEVKNLQTSFVTFNQYFQ